MTGVCMLILCILRSFLILIFFKFEYDMAHWRKGAP